MTPILRLLAKAATVAADLARTSVQLVESAAEVAIAEIRDRRGGGPTTEERTPPPPAPPPPSSRARPARAARPAPPPPAASATAPAPADPEPAPVAVVPEPTRGQAARIRAEQRAAEQTEDSPGPEIRVGEPWPGYGSMNAPEIIDRAKASDEAVKAVVLLYERAHRNRKTVVQAVQP